MTATTTGLSDYGGYYRSTGTVRCCSPATGAQVQAAILQCNADGVPMRVRGNGHSMNGSAVPRRQELLLSTAALNGYRFDAPGSITVGAGAAIWDVDRLLGQFGYRLQVCNDGDGAAASVGGFASAGGFGPTSWRHGGFWETVTAITFVSASGQVCHCSPGDALFPWLFGSMGQLGVFVDLTLRIEALAAVPAAYPAGARGLVQASHHAWEPLKWHTVFVPLSDHAGALRELVAIGARHPAAWRALPPYSYRLAFRRFNPPLIHPLQQTLAAIGIWGTTAAPGDDFPALRALANDVDRWMLTRPDYRRYLQTELLFDDVDFAAHFGPAVFNGLRDLKRRMDPAMLLGQGSLLAALAR